MQFITSPNKILGLDISELSLKAVQIRKKRGKRYIQAINSVGLPSGLIEEGIIKNQEKVAALIKKLIKHTPSRFSTKYAVVCLPETKTFIKVIEVDQKEIAEHKVRDVIMHELPRHIPVNTEEVQIDWQLIESSHKKNKYLVGAVPKAVADDYIKVCQLAGLKVVALEVEAQAITRCILPELCPTGKGLGWLNGFNQDEKAKKIIQKSDGPKIILDLGATRTGLILIDHGCIQFTTSLSQISGEKITAKIMAEKKLSYSEAEKAKIICGIDPKKCRGVVLEIIKAAIDDLAKEIINADNFYQTHFGQETHNIEILLCGGWARLTNIEKILEERLKRSVKIANPLINLERGPHKKINNLLTYTTAIGLALRNYVR